MREWGWQQVIINLHSTVNPVPFSRAFLANIRIISGFPIISIRTISACTKSKRKINTEEAIVQNINDLKTIY